MNINITATADELTRIERAARFSGESIREFALNWIMAGVEACEDDYILHNGEVIGDKREIETLAKECQEAL